MRFTKKARICGPKGAAANVREKCYAKNETGGETLSAGSRRRDPSFHENLHLFDCDKLPGIYDDDCAYDLPADADTGQDVA